MEQPNVLFAGATHNRTHPRLGDVVDMTTREMVRGVACGCHGDEGGYEVVMLVRGVGDDRDGGVTAGWRWRWGCGGGCGSRIRGKKLS
ncbi:hypothetical protein Tco_1554739 [Tanacetum coccineum]